MVGNMRKRKKGRKGQRNRQKPSQWLWKRFLNSLRKLPEGPRWTGWACYYCGKPPPAPCLVRKGPHWKRDCPQRHRFQGSGSQDNLDRRCPGVPTQPPILITPGEPQVLITVRGQSVDFLLDTGATYSVLTEAPGLLSSQSASVMGLSGWAKRYYFSFFVSCELLCAIFTRVSDCARVSITPFGGGGGWRYNEQGPYLFSWIWSLPFLSLWSNKM